MTQTATSPSPTLTRDQILEAYLEGEITAYEAVNRFPPEEMHLVSTPDGYILRVPTSGGWQTIARD